MIIETCCGSVDDVIQSKIGGATRVELNSNLFHGGITPSLGSLITAKKETGLEIMAMVRPREGGFCYTKAEYKTMLEDAKQLLAAGADGIVFGFLHEDGTVDIERCQEMLKVIGDKPSVFHRAIDVVPDWKKAIDQLIELGVTRILTSGQNPSVYYGRYTIKAMIEYAAGRIEILPGAGINDTNVEEVIRETGCTQIHIAVHKPCLDPSTLGNPAIYYGGMLFPPEDKFAVIDSEAVAVITNKAQLV